MVKSYEEQRAYREAMLAEKERRFWKQVKKQRKAKELKLERARRKGILKATPKRKRLKRVLKRGVKELKTSTKILKKELKRGVKTTSKIAKHLSKLPPYVPTNRRRKW